MSSLFSHQEIKIKEQQHMKVKFSEKLHSYFNIIQEDKVINFSCDGYFEWLC